MELTRALLKEINGTLSLNVGSGDDLRVPMADPSIDTRTLKQGDTFFGIRSEERDGCDYFEDAASKGARVIILNNTHRERFEKSDAVKRSGAIGVFVANTRIALKQIGFYNRLRHSIPFVAITGSNGKTTTKELISAILSKKFRVFKNEGNYNNDLGLPMELMKLNERHEVGVVELGMSALHEIENLASLVLPKIGVITCVGPAHIEFLKTLKNIAKAKAELIPKVDTQGCVILNFDNNHTRKMASLFSGKIVGFAISNRSAKMRATRLEMNEDGFYEYWCEVKANGRTYDPFMVSLPLPGKHNVLNSLAAISVGLEFGIASGVIAEAVASFGGVKKRMELVKLKSGVSVLNDCYNANPLSMRSAIETVSEMPGAGRKVAVVGDMLELGSWSVRAHREIGQIASKCGIDLLITVGEKAAHIMNSAVEAGMKSEMVMHFDNSEQTARAINSIVRKGDLVLIKGSRRMKLENVFDAMRGEQK